METKKFTAIMTPKIQRWWNKIVDQSSTIIEKELEKYSNKSKEFKKEIVKNLRKRNSKIDTYYNVSEVLDILEFDKTRPASFSSKEGEVLSDIDFKLNGKKVSLHHGHLTIEGKFNTIYWFHLPNKNEIIIIALIEEHPKNSRGYSKRELLKRLPKSIPDNFFDDSQTDFDNTQENNNETNSLYINSIGELTLKVRNQNNKLFIYEDSSSKKYLFIKTSKENKYIFTRLYNKDLRLIFFRNFSKDSDKPNISSIYYPDIENI